MESCNIQTIVHYPIPPHKQLAYKEYNKLSLPITEKLSNEVLSLPMDPTLTKSDLNKVNDFSKITICYTSAEEAIDKADAIAILTEWDEFKKLNFKKITPVFDGRNILKGSNVKSIGKNE